MSTVSTIGEMQLDGGVACLDFINSGYNTDKNVIVERLHTYNDLLQLAERLSLLDASGIEALRQEAQKHKKAAELVLQKARMLREVLFRVFSALAHGRPEELDQPVLDEFNRYINAARSEQGFAFNGKQLDLAWRNNPTDLMQPLTAFILSAYELLSAKDRPPIKECAGCQWLFIDETKNHRRRWCDMQVCGSIEKSRQYYHRKKMKNGNTIHDLPSS